MNKNTDVEKEESASKVSRMHVIEVSPSNLISVLGGRSTIYRKIGEQTIDEVVKILKSKTTLGFSVFNSFSSPIWKPQTATHRKIQNQKA